MPYNDRVQAGERLAHALAHLSQEDPLIVALTDQAVPVAYPIAHALEAELDVIDVRQLRAPAHPGTPLGVVGPEGIRLLDRQRLDAAALPGAGLETMVAEAVERIEARRSRRHGAQEAPERRGRTVVLVADLVSHGMATRLAARALRLKGPRRIVLATPVGVTDTLADLRVETDAIAALVTVATPEAARATYTSLSEVEEHEADALLHRLRHGIPPTTAHPMAPPPVRVEPEAPRQEPRQEIQLGEG